VLFDPHLVDHLEGSLAGRTYSAQQPISIDGFRELTTIIKGHIESKGLHDRSPSGAATSGNVGKRNEQKEE